MFLTKAAREQYAQKGGISDLQSVFFEYLQVINSSQNFLQAVM